MIEIEIMQDIFSDFIQCGDLDRVSANSIANFYLTFILFISPDVKDTVEIGPL